MEFGRSLVALPPSKRRPSDLYKAVVNVQYKIVCVCVCVPVGMITELVCLTSEESVGSSL